MYIRPRVKLHWNTNVLPFLRSHRFRAHWCQVQLWIWATPKCWHSPTQPNDVTFQQRNEKNSTEYLVATTTTTHRVKTSWENSGLKLAKWLKLLPRYCRSVWLLVWITQLEDVWSSVCLTGGNGDGWDQMWWMEQLWNRSEGCVGFFLFVLSVTVQFPVLHLCFVFCLRPF